VTGKKVYVRQEKTPFKGKQKAGGEYLTGGESTCVDEGGIPLGRAEKKREKT